MESLVLHAPLNLGETTQVGIVVAVPQREAAGSPASSGKDMGRVVERLWALVIPNSSEVGIRLWRVAVHLELKICIRHRILTERMLRGARMLLPSFPEEQRRPVVLGRIGRGPCSWLYRIQPRLLPGNVAGDSP